MTGVGANAIVDGRTTSDSVQPANVVLTNNTRIKSSVVVFMAVFPIHSDPAIQKYRVLPLKPFGCHRTESMIGVTPSTHTQLSHEQTTGEQKSNGKGMQRTPAHALSRPRRREGTRAIVSLLVRDASQSTASFACRYLESPGSIRLLAYPVSECAE